MAFTQNEIEEYERRRRAREESELSFTRQLLELMGLWRRCENRACRRLRACSDPRLCATRYDNAILEWKRTVLAPHLRKRYPSISWGAPAAVVEPQIEAALAAERARGATRSREARKMPQDCAATPSPRMAGPPARRRCDT